MNSFSANRAFYLLLTVSVGSFFLLVSLLSKIAPLTINHAIYFCQRTMQGISFSLPHSFPSLLAIFLTLLLSIGLSLFIYQVVKTEIFIRNILKHKVRVPNRLKNISKQLGIAEIIDVVITDSSPSFCYGFVSPRICLSLDNIRHLNDGELEAILIHESYHLKNKDPLKILFSQIVISMFFFVPILRDIHHFYTISKEINADQLVINRGGLINLKSALAKALNRISPHYYSVATFASIDDIEQRFLVLANPGIKIRPIFSPVKLLISVFVFIVVLIFLNLPVHAMENNDGTHSYVFMSSKDPQMVACFTENAPTELPFSSQKNSSNLNYTPMH